MSDAADNKDSLVLDLTFVPSWARRPPKGAAESGLGGEGDFREPRRERGDRGRREDNRGQRGPRRDGRDRREARGGGGAAGAQAERKTDERLAALEVSFLPERRGLAPLAHRLARSLRAYSLFEVSALFLSKPEFFAVRIAAAAGVSPAPKLFQCSTCKAVFLERDAAAAHVFARHFERYCRKEEKETEPPKGNFVCVARCGLSGQLLGPPNYHGYQDRILEVYKSRYAHMPVEAYRAKVETVHDPAVVEQWKNEMRRQVTYHFGEGEGAVSFARFGEAEAWFRDHCLAEAIQEGDHFVMPGSDIAALEDTGLRGLLQEAVQKETRFPLRLSVAVRLAFRHLGLHTFKTGDGHTFLTAVQPSAIDATTAVPLIREIIDYIAAHPGCMRQEMLEGLRPGLAGVPAPDGAPAPDAACTPEAKELSTQLRWLVEKGHVIEFSDGRLAAPRETVARVQPACPRHGHPRREHRKTEKQGSHT